MRSESQAAPRVLKSDALGRVELHPGDPPRIVRVPCGGRVPGSAWLARRLLARERRALLALDGLEGVPRALDPSSPRSGCRSYLDGVPLHRAELLPGDFFEHLTALVERLHARGVCHNDLHKEQNVIVGRDGRPALIDFQLASVHRSRGRVFRVRCGDDLRHVAKHARRYRRRDAPSDSSEARLPRRSFLAWAWRRAGKPVYNFVTRRLLGTRDGEERRPSSGPWPRWGPALGPIDAAREERVARDLNPLDRGPDRDRR